MRTQVPPHLLLALTLTLTLAPRPAAWASPQETTAAPEALEAWMPEDIVGYLKVRGLGAKLDAFLQSELRRALEESPLGKLARGRKEWSRVEDELESFRSATGKDPLQILRDLFGREVLVGARMGFGPEFLLLSRTAGEKQLEEGLKAVREGVAKRLGYAPQPYRTKYREREVETYDRVSFCRVGPVLVIATSQPFLEKCLELAYGTPGGSLRTSALFRRVQPGEGAEALATLAVRPQFIPNFNVPSRTDNPLGSLLVGGWLGALQRSEVLGLSLGMQEGKVGLEIRSVLAGGLEEKYRSFFPGGAADGLQARLEKRGILGLARIQRNLAQWWERREDLLEPQAIGGLVEFSQVMSNVFQGRNFGDEVLPEIGPSIALVARNQEYPDLPRKPRPAIPGFALLFELKDPSRFGDSLLAGFQSLVGIINISQAQKKKEGMMAMILRTEKVGQVDLHTVNVAPPRDGKPGIEHNFTPSLSVVGKRVVLSSSKELARVLVEELSVPEGSAPASVPPSPATPPEALELDGRAVHAILEENREILVADSMLKKGHSREAAEGEVGMILWALKKLRGLSLESKLEGEVFRVKLEVRTDLGGSPARSGPPARKAASL